MSKAFLDRWRHDLSAKAASFAANDRVASDAALPIPPPALIAQVNSAEKTDPRVFLLSGATDLLAIVETLLEALDGQPDSHAPPSVMELGCGAGRLLRHAPVASARIVSTDVNTRSLDWCRANLPGIEYHHHSARPPISSLPGASFDIIYAHSVFTHIPLERQFVWLLELERLLRRGGWLALTFLGKEQIETLLDAEQRASFSANGTIQINPDWLRGSDGGEPATFGAVCQTVACQEAAAGKVFDLCARRVRPRRQDILVLRRR